ncbi:restriction endonuclease subunit S [Micromonospora zhanjiangensis]|uniref:Restriction endonuclease subunit S n=1 Tax=Micromonospora zhanjiangensis TaxID=1522057 RepID=A0ABV8KXH4_9ACTN
MYGIVLPGPNVKDGVPVVKGGDVSANRLRLQTLNRTSHEIESRYAKSRLRGGDLVIAIRGSVGEVARVPDELAGANLTQDAARISPARDIDPDWLELILQAPSISAEIQARITGATVKGINIWDLKRIMIPTPTKEDQQDFQLAAREKLAKHQALRELIVKQLESLSEHKNALVTAAVTGQIDALGTMRMPDPRHVTGQAQWRTN